MKKNIQQLTMKSIAVTLASLTMLSTAAMASADAITDEMEMQEQYRQDMKDNPWVPGTDAWNKRIRDLNNQRQSELERLRAQEMEKGEDPTGDDTTPTGEDEKPTEPTGDDTKPTGEDEKPTEPTGDDTKPTGEDEKPTEPTGD
ncbi:MAG: hypothetical protein II695_08210, partial [Oscillospiraceae bacterium]|nr:hypothetical protein [Oscillospiraceae bacterium]